MGYTLQLQWSYTPPAGRAVPLSEIIAARVLEFYGNNSSSKSSLQLRTYRAQFPSKSASKATPDNRYLTIISSLPPTTFINQSDDTREDLPANDDTAYLFLDNRSATQDELGSVEPNGANDVPSDGAETAPREDPRYQCLAVRPSSAVGPMLQSLLSPFVLGLTKAARTAASQTSSTPVPTTLPGTTLMMTCYVFSLPRLPTPPVILRMYVLPSTTAGSIILQGEYNESVEGRDQEEIKKEVRTFLEGCLYDELRGDIKWIMVSDDEKDWEEPKRSKKAMLSLAKALRQSNFI
ncbi:hypothetical protein L204_103710 [Cryptococcus depauperatus]|nr:hypothetical protein L204_02026 [Cryptococcus depauperatus CBS 7855]